MKMNIRAWLLAPWIILFLLVTTIIVVSGSVLHLDLRTSRYASYFLWLGVIFCFYSNYKTITKAGIWISHSIPKYLRPSSLKWVIHIGSTFGIAYLFFKIGQISWIPLYWQGFVLPLVFTVCLIFILRTLLSPVLIWCANLSFIRLAALVGSAPILLVLPLSGILLGDMILKSYEASLPKPLVLEYKSKLNIAKSAKVANSANDTDQIKNARELAKEIGIKNPKSTDINAKTTSLENSLEPKSERSQKLKALALSNTPCINEAALVSGALHERNTDDVAYWATKAVACANLRPVGALTKLVDIMLKHSNPHVKAAAIQAMGNFKNENVEKVGYLLVKQINEKHSPEAIEAASSVYSRLGATEYNITMRKLRAMFAHPTLHAPVADIMVRVMKREDLILEYITTSLNEAPSEKSPIKLAALEMVCVLPKNSAKELELQVGQIVGLIESGDNQDPAKKALDCLGATGLNAIRNEIKTPKILNRVAATKVLSHMEIKNSKEVLDTLNDCIYDRDPEIRKHCSSSLGKVGVAALPKILELMNASHEDDKKSGEEALGSLQDPLVKNDLLNIRAKNSGWLATQKKLRLVRSIDSTLLRLEEQYPTQESNILKDLHRRKDNLDSKKNLKNLKDGSKTTL
jgi:hypothetical protein